MQTTLTRIFIGLESVSQGLSENWDEISRKAWKFKVFSAQNQVVSKKKKKKKKKGLHRNWDWFSGLNPEFKGFFRPNSGGLQKKKKKRSSPKLRLILRPNSEFQTFEGAVFLWGGGYFQFSTKNRHQKHQKVRFCILHKPMGGSRAPPPPPLATLLLQTQLGKDYPKQLGNLLDLIGVDSQLFYLDRRKPNSFTQVICLG